MARPTFCLLILLTTLAGCGASTAAYTDAGTVSDAGIDAGPDAGSDGGCHSAADCQPGQICYYQGEALCGGPAIPPPVSDCDGGNSCPSGEQCFAQPIPPCVNVLSYFLCEAPCSSTSCAAGTVCGSSGQCEPQSCTAGFSCTAPAACHPDGGSVDEHGCAPPACTTNADCAGFFCVDGFCRATPGECTYPPV